MPGRQAAARRLSRPRRLGSARQFQGLTAKIGNDRVSVRVSISCGVPMSPVIVPWKPECTIQAASMLLLSSTATSRHIPSCAVLSDGVNSAAVSAAPCT
jgi:hypothetical protein